MCFRKFRDFGHAFETEALEAVVVFDIAEDGFRFNRTHAPVIKALLTGHPPLL